MKKNNTSILFLLMAGFLLVGCEPANRNELKSSTTESNSQQDVPAEELNYVERQEAIDLTKGKFGGRVFKFNPPEFHGEWLVERTSDIVRVYVFNEKERNSSFAKADSLIVRGKDGTIYSLDAELTDADEDCTSYILEDLSLVIAMKNGVSIEMELGDKLYTAEILAASGD
ncbi:MAG: hypothetical protein AAGA30_08950 [Planctomycetota bacterium]